MAEAHFMRMTRQEIEDGSWLEQARAAWSNDRVGLILIEPEPSGDTELRQAVETMLDSNGSYQAGDHAVIHSRPAALALACETAQLLQERGISVKIVFGMTTLARGIHTLLRAVYAPSSSSKQLDSGGQHAATYDFPTADPRRLDGIVACYRALLHAIEEEGRAHWIVPIGTSPDPDTADVPALDLFTKVASRALAPIGLMRNSGQIRSHDIWLNPNQLDVDRLNKGLPAEQHWTLAEWRSLIFRSMAVSAEQLHKLAMGIEGVRLTIKASLGGGTLRYQRDDGTDFTYRVAGRPIILDCGRVGENSLGGTAPFSSAITNQPTTEVFVGPIEDSMNGRIIFDVPERTVHGVIRAPYRIEISAGKVTSVDAPDDESRRILRNYTGLETYDGIALSGDEATAFTTRRIIAEMAIAGFNPVMLPEIQSGRLRPVTGLVLTDEKLGDHQAFGANDQFNGNTPSSCGDHRVEHTDFVGGIDRKLKIE